MLLKLYVCTLQILVGIEGTARSVVGTETGQREAAINNLKKEISEKEKQLKEVHMF